MESHRISNALQISQLRLQLSSLLQLRNPLVWTENGVVVLLVVMGSLWWRNDCVVIFFFSHSCQTQQQKNDYWKGRTKTVGTELTLATWTQRATRPKNSHSVKVELKAPPKYSFAPLLGKPTRVVLLMSWSWRPRCCVCEWKVSYFSAENVSSYSYFVLFAIFSRLSVNMSHWSTETEKACIM